MYVGVCVAYTHSSPPQEVISHHYKLMILYMTKIHTIGIDVSKDKLSLCNTDGNMFVEFPNDIPSLEQYTIAHNIC